MQTHSTQHFPKMAWLLTLGGDGAAATLGSKVTVGDEMDWFFEGGWAYTDHPKVVSETGVYLGSGAVDHQDGTCTLICPSHSLEGLYVAVSGEAVNASNSLALLLAAVGLQGVDANALSARLWTVIKGLVDYDREIYRDDRVSIRRFINANVRIGPGGKLTEYRQSNPVDFASYDDYLAFLLTVLRSVTETSRATGYTVPLSKGYDSVACAALAARLGGGESLSLETARDHSDDDGSEIGALLGLRTHLVPRPERQTRTTRVNYPLFGGVDHHAVIADSELDGVADYFSGFGLSDEILRIPDALAADKVLLTGFHGDRVWGSHRANPDIVRGDPSGTGLVERRLKAGMVHAPVPMIGVQGHPALRRLTYSEEMRPWRVGGNYDRPIPRRIAEEMGVPREMFGVKKAAVATLAANRKDIVPKLLAKQVHGYAEILSRSGADAETAHG